MTLSGNGVIKLDRLDIASWPMGAMAWSDQRKELDQQSSAWLGSGLCRRTYFPRMAME